MEKQRNQQVNGLIKVGIGTIVLAGSMGGLYLGKKIFDQASSEVNGHKVVPSQNIKLITDKSSKCTESAPSPVIIQPRPASSMANYALYPVSSQSITNKYIKKPNLKPTTTSSSAKSYAVYPTSLSFMGSANNKTPISNKNCINVGSPIEINVRLIEKAGVFTPGEVSQLIRNSEVYKEIASKYNLPWQLLASVHWRETNLSMVNPGNRNGLFQVYSSDFEPGLVSNSSFVSEVNNAASLLASHYKNKAHIVGSIENANTINIKDIGNLLMAWNGQAPFYFSQAAKMGFKDFSFGFMGSPYVVNLLNKEFNSNYNHNWQQIRYDHGYGLPADQRPGTLPVFVLLMQATSPQTKLDFSGFKPSIVHDLVTRF